MEYDLLMAGGLAPDDSSPLDGARVRQVRQVFHGERCLGIRSGPLGSVHIRQTAVLRIQ